MNFISPASRQDEELLGELAMKFRGTRSDSERQEIKESYSRAVRRLIDSGNWDEMPPPEDQLPDDWMPQVFFDYWLHDRGNATPRKKKTPKR